MSDAILVEVVEARYKGKPESFHISKPRNIYVEFSAILWCLCDVPSIVTNIEDRIDLLDFITVGKPFLLQQPFHLNSPSLHSED
jgi:hypothetical protein